ncbi:preprotein translocase subunit SecE [Stackebrandtia soli]|uniref:preprotein translocase subunit SecE n=1 Tax=Stackebrandtia soli TaxID=1892856 RepID=UPI0039E90AA7
MADDDSRNEDAPKRSGKSSKKDDSKAEPKAKGGKSDKSDKKSDDKSASKTKTDSKKSDDKKEAKNPDARRGPIGRLFLFFREVVEQLRKVVYPTRKELLTYTLVVLVFVAIMIAVITGFDLGFNRVVELVFGNESA